MANTKITGLTADTAPASTDVTVTVDDTAGTPVTKKATWASVAGGAAFSKTYVRAFVVDPPTGVAATDTAALNARITEAIAAGGGVVQAREGTYAINGEVDVSTLTAGVNVDLRGAGRWATVFRCDAAGAQIRFSDDPPVASGMRGGLSGDFTIDGNATATNPLFIGEMAEREFARIRVVDAAAGGAGVTLSGTQNCLFSQLEVSDCDGTGLRFTKGAGGNVVVGPEIAANVRNVEFTVSYNATFPYSGIPTDNKIIGGLIERLHGSGTNAHLYYGGGAANRLIGTRITVGAASMPLVLIRADDVSHPPGFLHLTAVDIEGSSNGIGIDSNVATTVFLTDCTFTGLAEAFRLGDTSTVEIDHYQSNNVTTRFANQSGGTNTEENLIRQRTYHPRSFTGDTADRYGLLGSVSGDSVPRFGVTAGGTLEWGPGTGARDVALGRGTTGRIDVSAGDSLRSDQLEVNGSAGSGFLQFNNEQSSAPAAPSAGRARLYIRDDGAGATELAMRTDSETVAVVSESALNADFGYAHKSVRKSADETLNNSDVMQADNELLLALGASQTWVGRVVAFLTGSTTADFKVDLTVPAGATVTYGAHHARAADTVMVSTGVATAGDVDLTAINAVSVLTVEFSVATAGTAGDITFRWAQNTATVADSTVKAGSYIEAHRIA